jgi:hypothetical protein
MLNSPKIDAVNCSTVSASNYSNCSNRTEKNGPDFSPNCNARNDFRPTNSKTKKPDQVNPYRA